MSQERGGEPLLRAFLEASPEPLVYADRAKRVVLVNEAARLALARAFDATPRAGDDFLVWAPSELRPALARGLSWALDGEAYSTVHHHQGRDTELVFRPVRGPDGDVAAVCLALSDVTDRLATARRLREELARARAIFDASFQLTAVLDPDGTVREANRRSLEFGGLSPEAVVGFPFWEARWWTLDEETQGRVRDSVSRATKGELVRHEIDVRGKGDVRATIDFSLRPVPSPDGGLLCLVAEGHDVTEARRARRDLEALASALEQRVAQRTEELRSVLAGTTEGFALFRLGGWFVDVNEAYCRMVGYERGELLDMNVRDVEAAYSPEMVEEVGRRLRETGSARFETRHLRKDGGTVDLEVSVNWADRAGGRYFAFMRDITARKELEAARARQQLILEESPDFVAMADREGRVLYMNPAARQMLGVDDPVGRSVLEFRPERDRTWYAEVALRTALEGRTWRGETTLRTAAGSEIPVMQVIVPHRGPDGTVEFLSTVIQDVSARRQAEEELRLRSEELARAVAQLEDAARTKDEFLASMSHELRTPLNGILGSAELLLGGFHGPLTPPQAKGLRTIDEGGRHLLALINDILDVAKIEAGRLRLQPEPSGLEPIVQATLGMVGQLARRKGIELAVDVAPPDCRVVADGRRLKQILANLLSNAVKFTPDGGRVGVIARVDDEARVVRTTVWDTGIGIAEKDLPRLFKPFTQLDSRLAREFPGTGLGLTLVRRMVELHGGSVEVESRKGEGSRFTFTLPCAGPDAWRPARPGAQDSPSDPAPVRPDRGGTGRREGAEVLLAEDDEDSASMVTRVLEARGYKVSRARTGDEAVAMAAAARHDVLIMDIQLPGLDGLEAIGRIREAGGGRSVPVLALTALAMTGDRERILAAGADAYLSKPCPLARVAETVDRLLAPRAPDEAPEPPADPRPEGG